MQAATNRAQPQPSHDYQSLTFYWYHLSPSRNILVLSFTNLDPTLPPAPHRGWGPGPRGGSAAAGCQWSAMFSILHQRYRYRAGVWRGNSQWSIKWIWGKQKGKSRNKWVEAWAQAWRFATPGRCFDLEWQSGRQRYCTSCNLSQVCQVFCFAPSLSYIIISTPSPQSSHWFQHSEKCCNRYFEKQSVINLRVLRFGNVSIVQKHP